MQSNSLEQNTQPVSTQTANSSSQSVVADINVMEIIWYLLRYWIWFVLFGLLGAGFMYYKSAKQSYTYQSNVTVILRDQAQRTSVDFNIRGVRNRVNVENERLQLRSRKLIARAVEKIEGNVYYTTKDGLRTIDLYGQSPIRVAFDENYDTSLSFTAEKLDEKSVRISYQNGQKTLDAPLGNKVSIGTHSFTVHADSAQWSSWNSRNLNVQYLPLEDVASSFQGRIQVSQPENQATVIELTVTDTSKERATVILEALVDAYNEDNADVRKLISDNTAKFIEERIFLLDEEIAQIGKKVDSFQRANRFILPEEEANLHNSKLREGELQFVEIETQRRLISYMEAQVQASKRTNDYLPLNFGIEISGLDGQITLYNNIKLQRDKWLETSGGMTDHPMVKKFEDAMQEVRENIQRLFAFQKNHFNVQLQEIRRQEAKGLQELEPIPGKQREWLNIEIQQRLKESLYTQLLTKREESAISLISQHDNAYVMDFDTGSHAPISPDTTRSVLIGLLAGLFIPLVYFVLKLLTDTKVYTRKDLQGKLDIPYLGDIPLYRGDKKESFARVQAQGIDSLSESFRVLRTNLGLLTKRGSQGTVLVSASFGESAGKTFTMYNLARSLSHRQERNRGGPRLTQGHTKQAPHGDRQGCDQLLSRRVSRHTKSDTEGS